LYFAPPLIGVHLKLGIGASGQEWWSKWFKIGLAV